ncbi:MAG TPA: response regulator [Caulobacteraceae bacterium]|jgi:CheY-like chemotaxis protein|nr:response regulator [Caulobacteraceae bacterium]
MAGLNPEGWINMEAAAVLLLDPNPFSQQVAKQILFGFGVRAPFICNTVAEAQEILTSREVNLVLMSDVVDGDTTGFDFVSWLRRHVPEPNCFTPVMVLSGHSKRANIQAARDCGANFILAKPVSVRVMLERVLWVARENRPFVDTGKYLGPERRFHDDEKNKARRRRNDPPEGAEAAPDAGAAPDVAADADPHTEAFAQGLRRMNS